MVSRKLTLEEVAMFQIMLTPAAGKRLIGKGMAAHPVIKGALKSGTIVVVAGTTNGYVAEEILASIGQMGNFSRKRFFRGISLPPTHRTTEQGRLPDESDFKGDVVIKDGVLLPNRTIEDMVESLKEGDIVVKGGNALDVAHRRAAVLIGNPTGGTVLVALRAVIGKRVRLMIPVGLEKRVPGNLDELAARVNAPGAKGLRLMPVPGEAFTEIDAIAVLTGAGAEVVAAGGVSGAEGSIWLAISGTPDVERKAEELLKSVAGEVGFGL
jgi:hypothetical protein